MFTPDGLESHSRRMNTLRIPLHTEQLGDENATYELNKQAHQMDLFPNPLDIFQVSVQSFVHHPHMSQVAPARAFLLCKGWHESRPPWQIAIYRSAQLNSCQSQSEVKHNVLPNKHSVFNAKQHHPVPMKQLPLHDPRSSLKQSQYLQARSRLFFLLCNFLRVVSCLVPQR